MKTKIYQKKHGIILRKNLECINRLFSLCYKSKFKIIALATLPIPSYLQKPSLIAIQHSFSISITLTYCWQIFGTLKKSENSITIACSYLCQMIDKFIDNQYNILTYVQFLLINYCQSNINRDAYCFSWYIIA